MSETQRASDPQRLPDETRTVAGNGRAMLDAATEWQGEMLRFCGRRMNSYFELSSRLWECKSPSDVFRLQTGFVQNMLADYRSETDVVCRRLLQVQEQAASESTGHHGTSYEAAILNAQKDVAKIIDLAKDQAARIVEDAVARVSAKTGAPPPKGEQGKPRGEQGNKSASG